ncbi:MAG TPA: GNAT family N-acetyltransferase [Candidatus Dormibacteraeota bacterium]|nr:GNAT family N-acetyltransferase [Candidatus Dormibacteraeota bacterium]
MAEISNVRIRQASLADAEPAAGVWLDSRRAAYPAIPKCIHTESAIRSWFSEVLMAQSEVWVAEQGRLIVAVMALDDGWIDQLYVAPSQSRHGLGSRLVATAKERAPGGLQLWTFESNLAARRFYERHQFVPVERTDGSRNEERSPDIRYEWQPRG